MRKYLKTRMLIPLALLATTVFASTAAATWNPLQFPRNGQFYGTPGTYFDTPEWVYAKQTAGTCSNIRVQLRRVSNGQIIFDAQPAAYGCPLNHLIGWQYRTTPGPDYPGGVKIWINGTPADGQSIGAYVCGADVNSNGC